MKNLTTLIITLALPASMALTNCNSTPEEDLHRKKMKDWREASSEAKLNNCMDFVRIWKEQHGEQITAEAQKEDAIKLVECLDQGVKELPKDFIDTMNVSQGAVSCCQYVIYGSIK